MKPPAQKSRGDYNQRKKKYSMDFDLFKLDFQDTMKLVMYFKGEKVKGVFKELIADWCLVNKSNETGLTKKLKNRFNCNRSTMQKFVYSKDYFPVYLIKSIILDLSKSKQKYFFKRFNQEVGQMKFGSSQKWLTFPKQITSELSWLCGAVAADGWITKEVDSGREKMGIIDQNKKTVLKAKRLFEKMFGCEPRFKRHDWEDCWVLIIDSITMTKFFTTFLGFHYGVKAHDICEPVVVKNSVFRLDFASGVMSFDGSVELDGKISLGVKSKKLAEDVREILLIEGLSTKISRNKQGLYLVKSGSMLNNDNIDKWVEFFDVKTEKGYRLYYLTHDFTMTVQTELEAIDSLVSFSRYPKTRPCPIYKIFEILKSKKSVPKQDLQKLAGIGHATLHKYTWLLRKANIVNFETEQFWRGHINLYKFNSDVSEWRVPMVC